jgi:tetratricopeptide (TPR) repeat protein
LAATGTVCLMAFIFVFGRYGEQATAGIDLACAEAAFQSAKNFEDLGNHEQAVRNYRQALDGRFWREERRYECGIALGDLLLRLGRYAEAIGAYGELPEEAFARAGALTGYVSALQQNGDLAHAERLGKIWLEKARAEQDPTQQLWANSMLGRICQDTARPDEALAYYRAAVGIDPACQANVHIAQILNQRGEKGAALQQLDALLANIRTGQLYEDAMKLRTQITGELHPVQ